MKLGDKCQYTGDNPALLGKEGYLVMCNDNQATVIFMEPVEGGTDLDGQCPEGQGMIVPFTDLSPVARFHVGQDVRLIAESRYGKKGVITDISNNVVSNIYHIQIDEVAEISVPEDTLIEEENFVAAPFEIGDEVTWKRNEDEEPTPLICHYTNSFAQTRVSNVIGIRRLEDGNFFVATDKFSYLSAKWYQKTEDTKANSFTNNFRQALMKAYPHGYPASGMGRNASEDSDRRKLINMLMEMALIPSESEINAMESEGQAKVRTQLCPFRLISSETIADWEGGVDFLQNYCAGHHESIYVIPIYNLETQVKIIQMMKDDNLVDDDDLEEHWIDRIGTKCVYADTDDSFNNREMIFYDPLDLDTLYLKLLELLQNYSVNSFIYELLTTDRIDEAVQEFERLNNLLEDKLISLHRVWQIMSTVTQLEDRLKKTLSDRVNNIQADIVNTEQTLRDLYQQIRELRLMLIGAKTENSEGEMLKQYFLGMGDALKDIELSGDSFRIHLKTDLMYFDDALYDEVNMRGQYEAMGYDSNALDVLDAIIHRKVILIIEEWAWYDTSRTRDNLNCGERYDRSYCSLDTEGIPNPHHFEYNCWGDNATPIAKAMIEGNTIVAVEQIRAAMSGLNVGDGAVMKKFINRLKYLRKGSSDWWNDNKCLRDAETGELYTVKEYSDKLKKEKEMQS